MGWCLIDVTEGMKYSCHLAKKLGSSVATLSVGSLQYVLVEEYIFAIWSELLSKMCFNS